MTKVPPSSIRHPPFVVVAVLMLEGFDRTRVPGPSFAMVLVPSIVESIVAVTFEATWILAVLPTRIKVPELTVYPVVLKARLLADRVDAVTEPGVPQNMASLLSLQACNRPGAPVHQLESVLLHMPEPPRFAPLEASLPVVELSVSQ